MKLLPAAHRALTPSTQLRARYRPRSQQTRQLHSEFLAGLQAFLWVVSIGMFGLVAWANLDQRWYQARAVQMLAAQPGDRGNTVDPAVEPTARVLATGEPIALLSIPRLGLAAAVAEGVSEEVLRRAIGHLPASALPGEIGNIALAAHRDSFFKPLEHLRVGDQIVLAGTQRHVYAVEWIEVVNPDRVDVAFPTPYPALTLITCYPFRYVGDAPHRYIVRARQIRDAVSTVPTAIRLQANPQQPHPLLAGSGG